MDAIWISDEYVLTGGRDCVINILNKSYKTVNRIDMKKSIPDSITPMVRSLCINDICENKSSEKILVGTYGSEIYEFVNKNQNFELSSC